MNSSVAHFFRVEAASGAVLIAAALVALAWANSPWADLYDRLWHTAIAGGAMIHGRVDLAWLVNDGLMTAFFFVVGLELRRELHGGVLSEWRRAVLPAAAALGGMIAPAVIFLLLAAHPPARSGWGVPVATDIAFALGVLALLGRRVPPPLRLLLLALAVIDDLGAVLVVGFWYSAPGAPAALLLALFGVAVVLGMQRAGVRRKAAFLVPALLVWLGFAWAGVQPTMAGVVVGILTPAGAQLPAGARREARLDLDVGSSRAARAPAEALIAVLHPWVAFGVMPFFALANAGVRLGGPTTHDSSRAVLVATALALLLGKPAGVILASTAALRLRVAVLPKGLAVRHLVVLGLAAGVGFTMALFIAQLAFADPSLLASVKLGVLAASAVAALLALVVGRMLLPYPSPERSDRLLGPDTGSGTEDPDERGSDSESEAGALKELRRTAANHMKMSGLGCAPALRSGRGFGHRWPGCSSARRASRRDHRRPIRSAAGGSGRTARLRFARGGGKVAGPGRGCRHRPVVNSRALIACPVAALRRRGRGHRPFVPGERGGRPVRLPGPMNFARVEGRGSPLPRRGGTQPRGA